MGASTIGRKKSGKLRRDIKTFVEGQDDFLPTVESLTEGDEVVTLTPAEVPAPDSSHTDIVP